MSLEHRFKRFATEYLAFNKVDTKLASRPDLHAFILLNNLVPDTGEIIAAAEHDQVWLAIDIQKLEIVITDDQIRELVRCGVGYDYNDERLTMIV